LSLGIGVSLLAGPAWSQLVKVKGPEGQASLGYGFGGVFFVDKTLKDEYDRLLSRMQSIKHDLDNDRIIGTKSLTELKEELKDLQTKLDRLHEEIEKKKTLVSMGEVHKQTETLTFDFGRERLLVVTAKKIRLEGWDGPQVKCVLEKQVIVPDKKKSTTDDEQFRSIRLVHKCGVAPRIVGKSSAEREADEQKYLAGPEASYLTDSQRRIHHLVITREGDRYRAFQGKMIDTISIEGLDIDGGNSQIDMQVSGGNPDGSRYYIAAQEMQRNASLTVYVPRCEAIALQNCEKGLIVKSVHGDLLVDGRGSYSKWWVTGQIHDLYGSLMVFDLPINSLSLSAIHGSVRFPPPLTYEYTWASPSAPYSTAGNPNLMSRSSMSEITCKNVEGDFEASFFLADLHLEGVAGKIDVRNDFGDTTLTAKTMLAKKRHRLFSESGRIEARFPFDEYRSLPIQALTIGGTISEGVAGYPSVLSVSQEATWPAADGTACTWRGMISRLSDTIRIDENDRISRSKMMRAIVNGEDDYPGMDLISRSGTVRVLFER